MLISGDHVSVMQAATHEPLRVQQYTDREGFTPRTSIDPVEEGFTLRTGIGPVEEGFPPRTGIGPVEEGFPPRTGIGPVEEGFTPFMGLDSPVDYSDVDFTGCRTNRQRLYKMAAASDGLIRLRDATDTLFNRGFSAGRKENLRVGLARILSNRGKRIEEGIYRLEPEA